MNRGNVLLTASLLLNAGLAAFLVMRAAPSPAGVTHQQNRQAREALDTSEPSAAQAVAGVRATSKRTGSASVSTTPTTTAARSAHGVRELVAELRRRGVDEGTVRRLGVAHAERLFRIAARELLAPRTKLEYWQPPTESLGYGRLEPAKLREFQRLRRARIETLDDLFGDVDAEATEYNSVNHYRFHPRDSRLEFAPPDKRLALTEYFERDATGVDRNPVQRLIQERTPTAARELGQFEKVRAILGPDLFDDYLRQGSEIAMRLKYELEAFGPTRAEFDALVRIDYEVMLEQSHALATTRLDEASATKIEDARSAEVRELLGDARYAEFERTTDRAFRHLDDLARELGLGQSASRAAYAHVERARKQMLAVSKEAPNLADPIVQDSVMKIRRETGDRIAHELGLPNMNEREQMTLFGPALNIYPQELSQRMYRWY